MFPALISEQLIQEFKFWDNGKVCRGMRSGMDLYRCIAFFPPHQSQQAYSLGITLCEQNHKAILTKAKTGYTVWQSLRSGEATCERQSLEPLVLLGAV